MTEETVRVYLHAHGYVCKRPTWTLRRKAEEQTDYVGKRVRVELLLAGTTEPEPLPIRDLVEADLWSQRASRCLGTLGTAPASRSLPTG